MYYIIIIIITQQVLMFLMHIIKSVKPTNGHDNLNHNYMNMTRITLK